VFSGQPNRRLNFGRLQERDIRPQALCTACAWRSPRRIRPRRLKLTGLSQQIIRLSIVDFRFPGGGCGESDAAREMRMVTGVENC